MVAEYNPYRFSTSAAAGSKVTRRIVDKVQRGEMTKEVASQILGRDIDGLCPTTDAGNPPSNKRPFEEVDQPVDDEELDKLLQEAKKSKNEAQPKLEHTVCVFLEQFGNQPFKLDVSQLTAFWS